MIKKTLLFITFSMMLLSTQGNAAIYHLDSERRDTLPTIPTQPIQNNSIPRYSESEKELFIASTNGDINTVKEIINNTATNNTSIPFHIARHWAKNAAEGGHIEIFRILYLLDSDPDNRDNVLIPFIRHSGHLQSFYISLAHNGDIDTLERLMRSDCVLSAGTINAIFDKALTVYKGAESTSTRDANTCIIYKDFMDNMLTQQKTMDKIDQTRQLHYTRFVLKEGVTATSPLNNVWQRESELWTNMSC